MVKIIIQYGVAILGAICILALCASLAMNTNIIGYIIEGEHKERMSKIYSDAKYKRALDKACMKCFDRECKVQYSYCEKMKYREVIAIGGM